MLLLGTSLSPKIRQKSNTVLTRQQKLRRRIGFNGFQFAMSKPWAEQVMVLVLSLAQRYKIIDKYYKVNRSSRLIQPWCSAQEEAPLVAADSKASSPVCARKHKRLQGSDCTWGEQAGCDLLFFLHLLTSATSPPLFRAPSADFSRPMTAF